MILVSKSQKGRILRLLIISALAVTLTGCAYFAPQQARQPSLTSERVWTAAKTLQRPSERRTINIAGTLNTHTKNAKSNIVPASLPAQPDDKSNVVINTKPNVVTKAEPPQSAQPDDKSNVKIRSRTSLRRQSLRNPLSQMTSPTLIIRSRTSLRRQSLRNPLSQMTSRTP